uniref:Protein kinase domain-containing protein n=1 Tax=Oryzias latipes TaxID=8090 RepID=A0A3P9HQI0_ORYLA
MEAELVQNLFIIIFFFIKHFPTSSMSRGEEMCLDIGKWQKRHQQFVQIFTLRADATSGAAWTLAHLSPRGHKSNPPSSVRPRLKALKSASCCWVSTQAAIFSATSFSSSNPLLYFDAMTDKHRNMYEMHDDDDHKAFIDLLKCILEVNPQRRITPSQALEHDFITMKHLAGKSKAAYAAGCEGVIGKTAPSHTHINPSASFTSSLSGSSNQSLKSSMSEDEIVDVREVPSAGSADEQSSDFSLNSSDSCEKPGIYKVQEFLGQGSFGKVAKCTKLGSPEMYAIKIITNVQEGKEEFESMKLIQVLDPDENHLMKMYECFSFQNVICLVYEILEESLVDFLIKNECKATPLTYVRAIAQQMFQALKALKSIGVVHCDIKLDNIMFADKNSLKFKLIDFGLAVESKELPIGTKIQATPFRAPEVILGLPLDESIDMWALGVNLATVYRGNFAFPDDYDYETIRAMVQIFGLPEEELLSTGLYTQDYFTWDSGVNGWRLLTFDMYDDDDHKAFIDLLKRMLEVNPQCRITPSQALEHDFITMKHLAGKNLDTPHSKSFLYFHDRENCRFTPKAAKL